jgi:hypothetical protein
MRNAEFGMGNEKAENDWNNFILGTPRLCRGTQQVCHFRELVRGPGARGWGSKNIGRVIPVPGSRGLHPTQEAARLGDRPVAPARISPSTGLGQRLADPAHIVKDALWFLNPRPLPPGLALASSRWPPLAWRPFQSAIIGSGAFHTSTSGGGMAPLSAFLLPPFRLTPPGDKSIFQLNS